MPVKILYICFSNSWGGLEKYSVSLAFEQKKRGHEVLYISRTGTTVESEVKSAGIPGVSFDPFRYVDIGAMLRIRRIVKEGGFKIVHAHHSEDLGLIAPALFGLKDVAFFVSLHMVVPAPKKDIYHRLEYKNVRRIFALGEEGMNSAIKNLPIAPEKVMELPYGLEVDDYKPGRSDAFRQRLGIGPEQIVLGVLSRLDPLKGQMEAIRAMPIVLKKYPDARLLLVGDETVHLRGVEKKRIEAEVNRLNLWEKVTILPYQRNVPEVICAMDVFLLPSHYESYSISVIEAKLCGVPIVAAESGGVPQNLGHGEYGVLVKPKDPDSLAEGILATLDDMESARRRAQKARENALVRYDKERILSIVEREYEKAAAGLYE